LVGWFTLVGFGWYYMVTQVLVLEMREQGFGVWFRLVILLK